MIESMNITFFSMQSIFQEEDIVESVISYLFIQFEQYFTFYDKLRQSKENKRAENELNVYREQNYLFTKLYITEADLLKFRLIKQEKSKEIEIKSKSIKDLREDKVFKVVYNLS